MSRPFPIFLFDMDGVLVEPHGYRRSIQATLNYFTEKMGLGDLYPGEEAIARFESINMSSEWDIIPVLLAAILDGLVGGNPGLSLPDDLLAACQVIRDKGLAAPAFDPARLAGCLGPQFRPGMIYSELALALNRADNPQAPYPHLVGSPLLDSLLAHSRDVTASLVTGVFEHYAIGSAAFETTFHTPPLFEVDSYLRRFDRPLLLPQTQAMLLPVWQSGQLGVSVYTARPSTPPGGNFRNPLLAYSPEAELVLAQIGLEEIPLVGYGQVTWLAGQVGCSSDRFIKPSPVHALAAIGAAFTRQVAQAVLAAERLSAVGEMGYYRGFPALSVHVFEDSGGNIHAVRQAAELLTRQGLAVQVSAWGIAASPAKRRALADAGAALVPDVNAAIRVALEAEAISQDDFSTR